MMLIEVLVATSLTLVVALVVLALAASTARASLVHPRAADEQQRLRAAFDHITQLVARAGEGLGGLESNRDRLLIPVLYPQRRGVSRADPDSTAFADRFTVVRGANPPAAAALRVAMSAAVAPVDLEASTCPPSSVTCGFSVGDRVLVADARATGEWFTVARVDALALAHDPAALSRAYAPAAGALAASVDVVALSFDEPRRQLRLAGPAIDAPMLDGVAGFEVSWFGDPRSPRGPMPPPGEGNCVVNDDGSPRLAPRVPSRGPWVELSPLDLSDGPWCGNPGWRFDADLFRVRVLRMRLRLERRAAPGERTDVGPGAPVLEAWIAPVNLRRSP